LHLTSWESSQNLTWYFKQHSCSIRRFREAERCFKKIHIMYRNNKYLKEYGQGVAIQYLQQYWYFILPQLE
jgi:hypothetical protein